MIMNDELSLFKQIIREGDYENTYKMAWAKALVELSCEMELTSDYVTISLDSIAKKYIKYYWDQTIFFNLIQGSNPSKPPVILRLVKEFISEFSLKTGVNKPIMYERAECYFEKLSLQDVYINICKQVVSTLKQDVSWRFLVINGRNTRIYTYNKGDKILLISSELLGALQNNESDLYDLINYRWGLILENFNHCPRINKKVKIMDESEVKRKSLNKYKKYLDYENPKHNCFICGEQIERKDLSIDHVIPWSYMYSDDLWNLVYVCKTCNTRKKANIPTSSEIIKLKKRNEYLLAMISENNTKSKIYEELQLSVVKDYVTKFWVNCKI